MSRQLNSPDSLNQQHSLYQYCNGDCVCWHAKQKTHEKQARRIRTDHQPTPNADTPQTQKPTYVGISQNKQTENERSRAKSISYRTIQPSNFCNTAVRPTNSQADETTELNIPNTPAQQKVA